EDVGEVGKRCTVRDDSREAHRRIVHERREAKRAAHRSIEYGPRHLSCPIALARQPLVHAVKVDTGQVRCNFGRRREVRFRRKCHGPISRDMRPRKTKAAHRARLADERTQSSVIALAPGSAETCGGVAGSSWASWQASYYGCPFGMSSRTALATPDDLELPCLPHRLRERPMTALSEHVSRRPPASDRNCPATRQSVRLLCAFHRAPPGNRPPRCIDASAPGNRERVAGAERQRGTPALPGITMR